MNDKADEGLMRLIFLLAGNGISGDRERNGKNAGREEPVIPKLEIRTFCCESEEHLQQVLGAVTQTAKERERTLFLADAGWIYQKLRQEGCYAAGYMHEGNRTERFSGASYVVEEPKEIDLDSYEKIWQRASGRPWCIAKTPRLFLREMVPGDLESLYLLYEDEEARRFLEPLSEDHGKEAELLDAYIERMYPFYGFGMWAVCRRSDGLLIGRAGLSPCRQGESAVELGYLIRKDMRGQGFAREAGEAILDFARRELGQTQVDLYTDSANEASQKTAKALGFICLDKTGKTQKWRAHWDDQ